MSAKLEEVRNLPRSIRAFFKNVLVPPDFVETRLNQTNENRAAILAATVLLFIARALEFKGNDILVTFLLSGGVVAFAYVFGWIAKRVRSEASRKSHAAISKWVAFLVAEWGTSLILIIIADLISIGVRMIGINSLTTLAVFLRSQFAAAVIFSIGGIALIMLKTKFLNRHKVGSVTQIVRYTVIGTLFNSMMVYLLVYARWQ
jgi:hypothetical protein